MKRIILTYDYELFFGERSGTVQRCLIEPTNLLLDAMDSIGARGTFFIDWQMLKYLSLEKDVRCQQDYATIVSQLKDIVRRGHRIELHIHPHWVDAKYKGDGSWDFSEYRHYSLSSFTQEEITNFFVEGVCLLEAIAREVEPGYKIVAFRAGGWAVQPFSLLKEGFSKTGILVDSSSAEGVYYTSKFSKYDFSKLITPPNGYFKYDDDVIRPDEMGSFFEFPIAVYNRSFVVRLLDAFHRKIHNDCTHIADGTHHRDDLNDAVGGGPTMLSMSWTTPLTFPILVKGIKSNLVTIIDHPKDFCECVCSSITKLKKYKCITYKDIIN